MSKKPNGYERGFEDGFRAGQKSVGIRCTGPGVDYPTRVFYPGSLTICQDVELSANIYGDTSHIKKKLEWNIEFIETQRRGGK